MTRLGRQIRSTVNKNNILQTLEYRGGCAPPTSRCRDFFILKVSLTLINPRKHLHYQQTSFINIIMFHVISVTNIGRI